MGNSCQPPPVQRSTEDDSDEAPVLLLRRWAMRQKCGKGKPTKEDRLAFAQRLKYAARLKVAAVKDKDVQAKACAGYRDS